ncbi:MAG: hypothetical protein LH630_01240 [Actinomycetia bacterium]|nr:hypothetical protein [Actinomycetes bacterium]
MRSLRTSAAVLVASLAVVLTGCGGDEADPAAGDTTPTAESSTTPEATPDDSASTTPDETETTDAANVGAFPEVEGFTYTELPGAAFKSLNATLKGTPQIEGVEAKLVEKNGDEAGLVMRMAIDPAAASTAGFEEGFLPGFAGGFAGTDAAPKYEDINGTKVVTIGSPDANGTAYAWLEGSLATIIVFQDAGDAEEFAQGALA